MGVALREVFASYGIEFERKNLLAGNKAVEDTTKNVQKLSKESDHTDKGAKELAKSLGDLAKVVGATALVRGFVSFIQGAVDSTLQMADMSRALGTTTIGMRQWQHVAEASGLPVEVMNSALQTLSQNMRAVQMGNGDMAYAFRRLHVPVRDANRNLRDTSDVMSEAGVAIASIENPTRRARLATQIFGDAGRQLIPIFEQGGTAVNGMREEVRELLSGNMEQMEQQSRKVRAEQARLNLAFQALTNTIVLQILPAFTWVTQGVTIVVRYIKGISESTYLVQAAMIAAIPVMIALFANLGAAMLAAFGPALLAMAPFIIGVIAAVVVVDELLALFSGGDSVIGQFIDSLFGIGSAKAVVNQVKQAFDDLKHSVEVAIEFVMNALQRVPGIGTALRNLGITGTTAINNVQRQATRGFIAPGSALASSNALTRQGGAITPNGLGASGGRRTQTVDARTTVGQIVVQGSTDPMATAEAISGHLANANSVSARQARQGLVDAVQDGSI